MKGDGERLKVKGDGFQEFNLRFPTETTRRDASSTSENADDS
jgi:hypothetical protein